MFKAGVLCIRNARHGSCMRREIDDRCQLLWGHRRRICEVENELGKGKIGSIQQVQTQKNKKKSHPQHTSKITVWKTFVKKLCLLCPSHSLSSLYTSRSS